MIRLLKNTEIKEKYLIICICLQMLKQFFQLKNFLRFVDAPKSNFQELRVILLRQKFDRFLFDKHLTIQQMLLDHKQKSVEPLVCVLLIHFS